MLAVRSARVTDRNGTHLGAKILGASANDSGRKISITPQLFSLERPWQSLDPAVAEAISPALAPVADEITAAIADAIPEYRQPMGGRSDAACATRSRRRCASSSRSSADPATGERPGRDVYVALGRGEFRAGRRLDALQHAYRVGARVAWRRISEAAIAAGLEGATLALLAESIFAYIDEISAESVEGYASAQAASAGERSRARQALVRLLVAGEPDAAEAQAAAAAAGWPLPRALAALAAEHRDAERFAGDRRRGSASAARVDELVCVLIADPDAPGRLERVRRAVEGRLAALGPTRPWTAAGESWSRAVRCVAARAARGICPQGRLIVAAQQLGTLAVHADPAARARPRGRPPGASRRADAGGARAPRGHAARLAAPPGKRRPTWRRELHVHPQTVRYRMARLRELFGTALDDPDARFELELALRAKVRPLPVPVGEPR